MNRKKWAILIISYLLILGLFKIDTMIEKKQRDTRLVENRKIYADEEPNTVREVFVTILPADRQSKKFSHTFEDVNNDTDYRDSADVQVKVLFQEGKNGSPQQGFFGFGLTDANAVMQLRGQSARAAELKSYKVILNNKGGIWHGFKTINLNKHPYDNTRIRNKLSLDYFKKIPGFVSLRTQFVRLYIKDISTGNFMAPYKDYGLFTHVENIDTDFLKSHGLDPKGALYKAENFEFYRYPDRLMLKTDADYNRDRFEQLLEIKGSDDHKKLLQMLNDVNNNLININEVIQEHFDRENYITWLAVNILTGNIDSNSRNYALYSPDNIKTWYFLPWDYDKSWGEINAGRAPWQEGISTYWGVVMHRRFLMNRENVRELSRKIETLSLVFSPENTKKLLNLYEPVVAPFLSREPDNGGLPQALEKMRLEMKSMPGIIEENKKLYYQSLQKPMPVNMGRPVKMGTYYTFKWDAAYDFQGDEVQYSIDISNSPSFAKIVYHKEGLTDTEHTVNGLPWGKYFWRLGIKDKKGHAQIAFDVLKENGLYYFGVQRFYVY